MKVAVDTSALVRLAWRETGAEAVVSAYRRLRRPALIVSGLIQLEAVTAIHAKAFIEKSAQPRRLHAAVERARSAALARLASMPGRGLIRHEVTDWDEWLEAAQSLAEKWAESNGARTLDVLHVAFALRTNCDCLLTCDTRQAVMARGEGLRAVEVPQE